MKNVLIVLIGLLVMIAGCATRTVAPEYTGAADPGSGLLLMTVHSPNEGATRLYFESDQGDVEVGPFPRGTSTRLVSMAPGRYELTALYVGSVKLLAEDYLAFNVEPGFVSYPGDLVMDGFAMRTIDRRDRRLEVLVRQHPELGEWGALLGSDIKASRRIVNEGFRRVPNTRGRVRRID